MINEVFVLKYLIKMKSYLNHQNEEHKLFQTQKKKCLNAHRSNKWMTLLSMKFI